MTAKEINGLFIKVASTKRGELSSLRAKLATAKTPAAIKLATSFIKNNESVIVFSAHRQAVEAFRNMDGWKVINGDTTKKERAEYAELFQAGKIKGIAGTIKAMGATMRLTRATHVIFIDKEWTPALNSQAENLAYGVGQTRTVNVHSLVTDCDIDIRVHDVLSEKINLINQTIVSSKDSGDSIAHSPAKIDMAKISQIAAEHNRLLSKLATKETTRLSPQQVNLYNNACCFSRRVPTNSKEQKIVDGLQSLFSVDGDRADKPVGFNSASFRRGNKLAQLTEIGLTDEEYTEAAQMLIKYKRQLSQQQ
jgi:hypothetical protein